jgi:NADH:ubiquinone oxidoreductase subunit 3 (subunit A)
MTSTYFTEYTLFITLFFLSCLVATILLTLNALIAKTTNTAVLDTEKLSAYECGFEPFEEARLQFNVHYYIVGILFLIFDIEIVYLFPCAVIFSSMNAFSYFVLTYFLIILTIGFVYE